MHVFEVPSGWQSVPMWSVATRKDRKGYSDAELLSVYREYGVIRKSDRDDNHNVESEDLSNYKFVKKGDLVLNKMKTWQGSLGVSPFEGIVSPAYYVCELSKELHASYIHYLLRSAPYIAMYGSRSKGIRVGQWDLPYEEFREIPVLLPPIDEQRRIADYLDVEIKRITDLVTLKKDLIEKYDELFNSTRNYLVVGKGVKGRIKNDDDWFSSVPNHWTKKPLRLLFSWQKGKDPARLDVTYCGQNPGPFPVYSGQTSNDGVFGEIDTYDFEFKEECNLITTVGARAGSMRILSGKFSLSQNCALLAPKSDEMSAAYLNYLWPTIWNDLSSKIPSDMQPSVRLDDLKRICVYVPPKEEQREIVSKLKKMESEYLSARSRALVSIDLYNEYMNSVITETVTGSFSTSNAKVVC